MNLSSSAKNFCTLIAVNGVGESSGFRRHCLLMDGNGSGNLALGRKTWQREWNAESGRSARDAAAGTTYSSQRSRAPRHRSPYLRNHADTPSASQQFANAHRQMSPFENAQRVFAGSPILPMPA